MSCKRGIRLCCCLPHYIIIIIINVGRDLTRRIVQASDGAVGE